MVVLDFPPIAFQSSLAAEAILFAVFGVFYSVYANIYSNLSPTRLDPPKVVIPLRRVCRVIAILVILNAIIAVYSLIRLIYPSLSFKDIAISVETVAISFLLFVTLATIAITSGVWAFKFIR